ncbi:MAG: nicotinamide riboside transporter PnuC [Bifidobacteriaceae bacterium]|jgi:nicotinamide mononucleotide transporter|nr:nicotinamide riboside transporter PnuC [Bifidobacteriaceae bacterium]
MTEIIAFGFTALYIVLELWQKKLMWLIGILSSIFYILVFYHSKIYADMTFNFYYLAMSFYGLILWLKEDKTKKNSQTSTQPESNIQTKSNPIIYRKLTKAKAIYLILAELIIYIILWWVLTLTDSPIPAADALLTSLNIIGTYMLTKRYLSQWYIWFGVNILSIVLFYNRNLLLTSLLYTIYSITSIIGYFKWRKNGQLIT